MAQNFYRLVSLINEISSDVLRKYLEVCWQNAGFISIYDLLEKKKKQLSSPPLTKLQWEKLFKRDSNPNPRLVVNTNLQLTDLDVTLTRLIIIKLLKPSDPSDESAVEAIRELRNDLSHISTTRIDDTDFELKWTKARDNTLRLAKKIPSLDHLKTQNDIDGLQTKSLDERECNRLLEMCKHFCEDISDKLVNIDGQLGNIAMRLESKEEIIDRDPRIKRLIENTKLTLETHKKSLYVANSNAETVAYKRLIKHHRVTLSGRGGSGKTSLAKQLMVKFCEEKQQYTAAVVQTPKDVDAILGKDNLIIFIDDPFGSSNTNREELEKWEKRFGNMLSFCQDGNVHIIIGCRSSIMTECNDTLIKHGLFLEKKTVDMSSHFVLTSKYKLELLEAYCKQHNLYIDSDTGNEELMSNSPTSTYQISSHRVKKKPRKSINRSILKQISETDPFWGFPQTCNLFFSVDSLFWEGIDFFTHADKSLKHDISRLRKKEPIQYFSMVLMVLEDGKIDLNKMNDEKIKQLGECLGQKYTKCDIVDCISHEISKIYIENVEISTQWSTQSLTNIYQFTHATILESVLLSFCNRYPEEFLKLGCDIVIIQFARSCKYQQTPGEICFNFPVDCQKQLARRLISENFNFIMNNSTSDESFVEVVLNELEVHDVPFVFGHDDTDPNATRKDNVIADLLHLAVSDDRYFVVLAMCKRYLNYKQVYSEESMTAQPYPSKPKLYVKSFLHALNYILEKGKVAIAEELIQTSGLDISCVHKSGKPCTRDAQRSFIMCIDDSELVCVVCYAAAKNLKSLFMFCLDRLEDEQLKYIVEKLVHYCCKDDWVDVLTRFEDKYTIVLHYITNTLSTLILQAAKCRSKNMVLYLLKYNVDFTVIDESENSLCHYCAEHGWKKEVALCVKSNPKLVNAQNEDAMTPILIAAKNGKKETVLELLQHGADTSLQDNNGNTVYHYYAANDWDDIVKNCVKTTLVLSCKNKKGFLPLHIAMVCFSQKVVELLLDSRDYSHHELFTAFQMICVGHFDVVCQYNILGLDTIYMHLDYREHIHNCICVFEYILRHNHDTLDSFCKPLDENGYTIIQLSLTSFFMCDCVIDWLALNYKKALFVRNKTELPTTLHMAAYFGSHRLFTNLYQRGVRCSDGDLSITDTVKLGKQNAGKAWDSDGGWVDGTSECLFRKTVFPYGILFNKHDDYDSILEFCVQNSIH